MRIRGGSYECGIFGRNLTFGVSEEISWTNGERAWRTISLNMRPLTTIATATSDVALLDSVIHHAADHVPFVDVGPANQVTLRVISLSKDSLAVTRESIIV